MMTVLNDESELSSDIPSKTYIELHWTTRSAYFDSSQNYVLTGVFAGDEPKLFWWQRLQVSGEM